MSTNDAEFEQAFEEVMRSLVALKERYAQVKEDQQRQAQLLQRQKQLRKRNNRQEIQAELKQIQTQLETIELNLESSLLGWDSLKEPFWQAVRFGGLGVILGWILKSFAG